jgi:DtxR family Mn-dependent transcriptional regulator
LKALSQSEENYLKAIFKLAENYGGEISTTDISTLLQNKAASVTDMLQKLAKKKLITYKKYKGVNLTETGNELALKIIRKHRLWESFLVQKLNFNWDEIHEIAEQLEHIQSDLLIQKLDEYLGFPKTDPHGDAIPDNDGKIIPDKITSLLLIEIGNEVVVKKVSEQASTYLQHLNKLEINIDSKLLVLDRNEFDSSLEILIHKKKVFITKEVAQHIFVIPSKL